MGSRELGRVIMAAGGVVLLVGLLTWLGALSWFGRLPGDIRVESDSTHVYVPIVSMLLVSFALSLLAALFRRLF